MARDQYLDWVEAARKEAFPGRQFTFDTLLTRLPAVITAPGSATASAYEVYTRRRDWAEFVAAGREPAWVTTPELYVTMLHMRDLNLRDDDAAAATNKLIEEFGNAAVAGAGEGIFSNSFWRRGSFPSLLFRRAIARLGGPGRTSAELGPSMNIGRAAGLSYQRWGAGSWFADARKEFL